MLFFPLKLGKTVEMQVKYYRVRLLTSDNFYCSYHKDSWERCISQLERFTQEGGFE